MGFDQYMAKCMLNILFSGKVTSKFELARFWITPLEPCSVTWFTTREGLLIEKTEGLFYRVCGSFSCYLDKFKTISTLHYSVTESCKDNFGHKT
jgi:hypothetical protein